MALASPLGRLVHQPASPILKLIVAEIPADDEATGSLVLADWRCGWDAWHALAAPAVRQRHKEATSKSTRSPGVVEWVRVGGCGWVVPAAWCGRHGGLPIPRPLRCLKPCNMNQ